MSKIVGKIAGPLVFFLLFMGVLEAGLRVSPELIHLGLLKRFQKDLRLSIAQRRELWNESQMREIERDDGGPPLRAFKPNARLHYHFRDAAERGTMVLDGQGFCNQDLAVHDRPEVDAVILGDSFAWCISIEPEAAWTAQLGVRTELSVLSLGRGGIGPYDYLQMLRNFGLSKHPDVVVMQIYEGNDLRDSIRYHEHVAAAREGKRLYAHAGDRARLALDYDTVLDNPIGRNSYSVNMLVVAVSEGVVALAREIRGDTRSDENFRYELRFPDSKVPMNLENADESEVRAARRLRDGEADLSAFDEALARFAELGREHGFTPMVTYAPSAYTAYASRVEFEDESLTELMPWFSETQRRYVRELCGRLGIEFLDLTPALQEASRELGPDELLYWPINVHWTQRGNGVVAETLAPALMRLHGAGAERDEIHSILPTAANTP